MKKVGKQTQLAQRVARVFCKRRTSSCENCSKVSPFIEKYEQLLTRSQLLNTLGQGYARGATGHYALGHPDIFSESLNGRRSNHPNS
jgi:hypothetical protein